MQATVTSESKGGRRGRGNVYPPTTANGSKVWVAQLRVTPLKPISKRLDKRAAAQAGVEEIRRSPSGQKERGADGEDHWALRARTPIDRFRADPDTAALRYDVRLESLLGWRSSEYGTVRVADLGVLTEIGSVLGHKSPAVTMRRSHLVQGAPVTGQAALDSNMRGASKAAP